MANCNDIIKQIEIILKENASNQQQALYSGDKQQISGDNESKLTVDVNQVICNVSRQMKAIQRADCPSNKRNATMNKYKKSLLIPVNMLGGGELMPLKTNTNKFETQFVSDTQLINIVQDVEEIVSHRGMTQEFDSTFYTQEVDNICPVKIDTEETNTTEFKHKNKIQAVESKENNPVHDKEPIFPFIDISLKEPDQTDEGYSLFEEEEENNNEQMFSQANHCIETQMPERISISEKQTMHSDDIDYPSSPVFNVKAVKKTITTPSLVFDLQTFEKFEKIAIPIVEESTDQETAKYLIKSQILGKELFLQLESEPVFYDNEYQVSPIIEWSDDKFKFDNNFEYLPAKSESRSKKSSTLKDEILFSSDEETECGLQQYDVEDLPFTCALATSFYELPDVLDKTMYVGFQTASNKSIQICTESFYKARSILDDCEKDILEKPSLTQLVEMCDGKNSTANADIIKSDNITHKMDSKNKLFRDTTDFLNCKDVTRTLKNKSLNELPSFRNLSEKSMKISQPFEGSTTARNKKICLSEALPQTKKIFKDISVNENCEQVTLQEINSKVSDKHSDLNSKKKERSFLQHVTVRDEKKSNLDDSLLLEFENIAMSHENIDTCKDIALGFKTASKGIQISYAAMEKSKRIFDDIDETGNVHDPQLIKSFKQTNVSFKSASNKEIKISDQALSKTRSIFHDLEAFGDKSINIMEKETQFTYMDVEHSIWDRQVTNKIPFVGFKTANNKEIKISNNALGKTKNMFQEIIDSDISSYHNINDAKKSKPCILRNKRRFHEIDGNNMSDNSEYTEEALLKTLNIFDEIESDATSKLYASKTLFEGFQTASKRPITIPNDTLEKSKENSENSDDDINKGHAIFQTANNKPIIVSKQALIQSKKIFDNINNGIVVREIKEDSLFKKLHTARNKAVKVSEDALAKSKNVFEYMNIVEENSNLKTDAVFKGFQTASNKKVIISEQALARSKKIFENIDKDNDSIDTEKSTNFKGFQMASNKKVHISPQALARSKNIFKTIDVENESIEGIKGFQGFKTASNNKVIISEHSLYRSKNTVENLATDNEPNEKIKSVFRGFQTASNKKVNISVKALGRSKIIFENIDTENNVDSAFQGLKTGNNKKVNTSEQALAKSEKMFKNIDTEKYVFDSPRGFPFKEFQTASNREDKISKDITAKSKYIFQDTDIIPKHTEPDNDFAISQVNLMKSANNSIQNVFKDSKSNLADLITDGNNKLTRSDSKKYLANTQKASLVKDGVNLENVIDTQVMIDFDNSLHTEDFLKATTPAKSKRSGSPILSCPKAKRRKKFETPNNKTQKKIAHIEHFEEINKNDDDDIKPQTHIFDKNYKKTKKYNLNDIRTIEKRSPDTKISIDSYILEHSFENLLKFEFVGTRNELSKERWTTDDLKKYFLNSVNKKFVPDGWIDNHLKLIIWKLISYEIKFPKTMGVVCTSTNIMEQLKYRYDKELFNSERPALRKIMEKDDVSTKLLVLCVVAVFEDGVVVDRVTDQKCLELLLTDGWYCIRACLDRMLCKLVAVGRIAVGSKIATYGSVLMGCEQGVAPWEDTSQIRLKLAGNSTRRARWDARLGYHGNRAVLGRLRDVTPDGGRVGKLRVLVTRVYPTLYVEKFDDGSTVTRSERLELLQQMKYENDRQGLLEKLYEEVQKEFSDELNLTETQVDLPSDHATRKRDRLIQEIQIRMEERISESGLNVRRNVIPLVKIRIADVRETDMEITRGMLSIWKPNDAIADIVNEGAWIEVINVIPTAIRYSEIQISAGRQSILSQYTHKENEKVKPHTKSLKRICYHIKDLAQNPAMKTEFNEIDTVGMIFSIEPSVKEFDSNRNQFQNVYLADADKNMICLNFWGGVKKLGFENILDTGQVVACMNLQKRAGNTRKNILQYRVTEFSYFTKTPKNEIARNIVEDLDKKLLRAERNQFGDDCVALKNNFSVYKMQNYNENVSPYRCQNVDVNLSKNKIFIDSPLVVKNNRIDENLNLSGLDFESTFKQIDTLEYSPKTLLRKRKINEKIDKLRMYGEPPALSPMQILNKSKDAGNAFKSPLLKCDIPKSVANASEILLKEENVESCEIQSPVMMNRTFVKRTNVNPVKLDFNSAAIDYKNASNLIDHFAEEFDGSPPLSLD